MPSKKAKGGSPSYFFRLAGAALAGLLVVNLILFATKRASAAFFWAVITICAAFAYLILPWMRKKLS